MSVVSDFLEFGKLEFYVGAVVESLHAETITVRQREGEGETERRKEGHKY